MTDKVHAQIDLSALRHNIGLVRRHAPKAKVLAVVKAMAYGHGAIPLAMQLQSQVDALGVARVDEATCLREAGISAPLLVLEGPSDKTELSRAARLQIGLAIHHIHQVKLLKQHAGQAVDCWLKLDTGMHRLGFAPESAEELYRHLRHMSAVAGIGLMSHLANADDTDDLATRRQIQRFGSAVQGLAGERSLANSAGILAWPDSHAEWVRPGLMMYGASPLIGRSAAELGLRPVMTLRAPLIALNELPAGAPVGYGGTWRTPEEMPVGVVGIGYGDGYPRHIGPQAKALINGQLAPVVGRVSMDMISVDLRGIPAEVGDMATLWGEGLPVEQVAAWADTIPYTLFCGLTMRVQRRYHD